jgi:hypothetical protein
MNPSECPVLGGRTEAEPVPRMQLFHFDLFGDPSHKATNDGWSYRVIPAEGPVELSSNYR